jgi:hypothetical protein
MGGDRVLGLGRNLALAARVARTRKGHRALIGALALSAGAIIFALTAIIDRDKRGLAMTIILSPLAVVCWWALWSSGRTGVGSRAAGQSDAHES